MAASGTFETSSNVCSTIALGCKRTYRRPRGIDVPDPQPTLHLRGKRFVSPSWAKTCARGVLRYFHWAFSHGRSESMTTDSVDPSPSFARRYRLPGMLFDV